MAKQHKNRVYSNLRKMINNNDDDAYGDNKLENTVFVIRIRRYKRTLRYDI